MRNSYAIKACQGIDKTKKTSGMLLCKQTESRIHVNLCYITPSHGQHEANLTVNWPQCRYLQTAF